MAQPGEAAGRRVGRADGLVRERRHFWTSSPSRWMILSSIVDVSVVCILSIRGILMAPLPGAVVGSVIAACAG